MYPWIMNSGTCAEQALLERAGEYILPDAKALLYHTDRFRAGAAGRLPEMTDVSTLLEMRVFDGTREFWAHRSTLGTCFSWRVADDGHLAAGLAEEKDPFLRDPKNHYIDTSQTLDIDATYEAYKAGETDEYGSRRLRTTGGGQYSLPIDAGDGCILLRNYIHYDENGAANIVDYRLMGFAPQKKGASA